ncbi:ABC transporter ATP-binding protein [Corynebacterium sp. USCH3]|uniref:ABC transporter ATP-binding protein n=1 Tax=Corynebacterium sp. USCH3 TaxID=3024840 RepID=UPI00309DB20A
MSATDPRTGDVPHRLPVATGRRSTAAVWDALAGRRGLLILAAMISAGAAALELVTPALLGSIVDDISGDGAPRPIWLYGMLIAVSVIAASALGVLGVLLASRVLERLLATLRERLVSTALSMPQDQVERSGTGDLISRASDDVAQVSEALSQVLPSLSRTVFTILLTLGALFLLDWRFGLTLLVGVPLYWLSLRWYVRTAPPLYAAERAAFGTRAHHLLSALTGLDTVLAYRLSAWHTRRVATSSWAVATWALRARTVQTMFAWRIDLSFIVVVCVVTGTGYALVDTDAVTVGAATAAVLYFLRLQGPLRGLMMEIDSLQAAAASLARIIGVTDLADRAERAERGSVDDTTGGTTADSGHTDHAVVVDDVCFSYDPDRRGDTDVLHGVCLTVPAEQRVAVVGTSGAGKTTLAALIAGIHRPTSGTVSAPTDTMLISQETHVFAGTLRDNLTLAAPGVDDDVLLEALGRIGADGLLDELPDGLDSPLGAQGHPLSAARQQHLALTRLLIADPDLAILDEATAEAGSSHAAALDAAADIALRGRTGLVIAHRLSQAAACDRIIVMDHGRILEDGSHDELVAAGGHYSRLWGAWNTHRSH